jgi:glutamate---cysteine ligase / carboxylate-amine ligase
VSPLHLFEAFGVELEYMTVSDPSLEVLPVVDEILRAEAGEIVDEVEVGPLAWSNELVLHVIELKTNGPSPKLAGLAATFAGHVRRINNILDAHHGQLMPGAMHPWMEPTTDSRLWPHNYNEIYAAYDRIFGCKGHGWSNLQSVHLNLPFHGDQEFGALHAAVRLILPILPAIAASSPIADGRVTGRLDTRLDVYRQNQRKIPSLTGRVIPEPVFTRADYEGKLLAGLYRDLAPFDPSGTLHDEWVNSRGAIARFDRDAIEIRVLDIQETPAADLAVLELIVATLRALCRERWTSLAEQQAWPVEPLAEIFEAAIALGERTPIRNASYLRLFGFPGTTATALELWRYLRQTTLSRAHALDAEVNDALKLILDRGPLGRRILDAVGLEPTRGRLHETYSELCHCLAEGELFVP